MESTLIGEEALSGSEQSAHWGAVVLRCTKQLFSSFIWLDYVLFGLGSLLLYPAYHLARFSFRIDFGYYFATIWGLTFSFGTFTTVIFAIIGLPGRSSIGPFIARLRMQKMRIVIALLLLLISWSTSGVWLGSIETLAILGLVELLERGSVKAFLVAFIPAQIYILVVAILQAAYNHAIAGIRFPQMYDRAFERLDAVVFHINVTATSHWLFHHGPVWLFMFMSFVYSLVFAVFWAVIPFVAWQKGQRFALKYVRTLMLVYVIALIIYFIFPAKGPYSICPIHVSDFANSHQIFYFEQQELTERVKLLWAHDPAASESPISPGDYFISFPSLHVVWPIVAVWFLRPWKRLAMAIAIFTLVLLPSIFLLEWHYFIDFLGGFATAVLAIWIAERVSGPSDESAVDQVPLPVR